MYLAVSKMRKISIWNHSTCVYHKRPSRFSESHIRKNSKNNSQNQEGECVITGTSYSLNSHFQGRTGLARQPTQARENAAHHRPRPGAAWALLLPGEQNNRLKFWLLLPFVLPLIVLIEVNDVSSHCNKSLGFSGEHWRLGEPDSGPCHPPLRGAPDAELLKQIAQI